MGMCRLPSKILDVTELLATRKTPDQQAGAGVSVNHLLQDYRWQPRNSPAFPTGCTVPVHVEADRDIRYHFITLALIPGDRVSH